jgi:hypothetical protein
MVESSKVNGRTIKWRAMGFSHGLMGESTKVTTSTTKRKATEYSTGKIALYLTLKA